MNPAPSLEDVAAAILDGTAVDWNSVESGTAPSDQPLVSQLKTLAALRLVTVGNCAGHNWGHLRVVERIGQGAFGEVYRAWDTRLDREVALKLLAIDRCAGTPESSVIEEGRLLARVCHPNVVTIYGAERIDGRIGLWMEFIEGRTLEELLKSGRTFSARDVTRLGIDLCHAVSAVHSAGLIHRDIKAHNVMVTAEGRLVLMDFGTGREIEGASDSTVAGTPLYLAPEVLSGGPASARSDVYSVGVVLYRLFTGSYPVHGRTLDDLRRAHAARKRHAGSDVRRSPDTTSGGIPSRLRPVIRRALDPSPERRYASAQALGDALLRIKTLPRRVGVSAACAAVIASLVATGWQFSAGSKAAPATPGATAAVAVATEVPTIAVLPFTNSGSEPDSEYFVDGLTSEVIRNLAVIEGLQVRSQMSSFSFKDKPRDLQAVGTQLNVDHVVEADVLRVGNRLRINAQLVRVKDEVPIWSEAFNRTLDDVFVIQDDISRAIVNKLRLTLGRGQRRYQTNIGAYQQYLRARALVSRSGTDNAKEAATLFEQVIASDRTFAPALAGLATAYATMSWELVGLSNDEGLQRMRPAALKALELDPLLAEAHAAMGIVFARERQWDAAARAFEQALNLSPSLTLIHTSYSSEVLVPTGQLRKAELLISTALVADPLSLDVKRELGTVKFRAGRYAEAIANLRQVLSVDPNFPFTNQLLARALAFSGNPEEAVAVWKNVSTTQDWERWIASAYVMTGRDADMNRLIAAHKNEHPYRQAIIYAARGDKDRTFEALNRAAALAPQRTAAILGTPEMALLQGDPRLEALRRRLNLQ